MNKAVGWRGWMGGALFLVGGLAGSAGAEAEEVDPRVLYGERAEFVVLRGDKPVGTHRLFFNGTAARVTVVAQTRATLSVLGLFEVPFIYDSLAVWASGTLLTLSASFGQGEEAESFWVGREGEGYRTSAGAWATAPLLPTNHWNVAAVRQTVLFNTLTGKLARVTVTPAAAEDEEGEEGGGGGRYEVRGDLDISLAYDAQGRWVRLGFSVLGGEYVFAAVPEAEGA